MVRVNAAIIRTNAAITRMTASFTRAKAAVIRTKAAMVRARAAPSEEKGACSNPRAAFVHHGAAFVRIRAAFSNHRDALSRTKGAHSKPDAAPSRHRAAFARRGAAIARQDAEVVHPRDAFTRLELNQSTETASEGAANDSFGVATASPGGRGEAPRRAAVPFGRTGAARALQASTPSLSAMKGRLPKLNRPHPGRLWPTAWPAERLNAVEPLSSSFRRAEPFGKAR